MTRWAVLLNSAAGSSRRVTVLARTGTTAAGKAARELAKTTGQPWYPVRAEALS